MVNELAEVKNTPRPTWTASISTSESPTVAVARLIAAVRGCEPDEVPALHGYINCDSLNQVIGGENPSLSVTFPVEEFTVEVQNTGQVKIVEKLTELAA